MPVISGRNLEYAMHSTISTPSQVIRLSLNTPNTTLNIGIAGFSMLSKLNILIADLLGIYFLFLDYTCWQSQPTNTRSVGWWLLVFTKALIYRTFLVLNELLPLPVLFPKQVSLFLGLEQSLELSRLVR